MLALTVNVGQAVQLGDVAVIKVADKSGHRVKLLFATAIAPILLIETGIIPERFTPGINRPSLRLEAAA